MAEKRTRGPNVAKKLVENSISAMLAAIEIHNKPVFSYRYETSVILFINARELLLKGYMYKYHPKVGLWGEDEEGNTRPKPFSKCLSFVKTKLGKRYIDRFSKIEDIYQYRCDYIHFYGDNLDGWAFMRLVDSIKSYISFIKEFFPKYKFDDSSLIIMPIGFKAVIDPIEFLSEISASKDSSKEVKEFIRSIIQSSNYLQKDQIVDGIAATYSVKVIGSHSKKEPDFLVKRDKDGIPFNQTKTIHITDDNNALITQISDEDVLNLFPYTYGKLRDELKIRYLDSDRTGGFDKIVQGQLKLSKVFSFERKHNPSSSKSSVTWYYSEKCLTEVFDKIYKKK